jgi:prolyl-tRNA synthetase
MQQDMFNTALKRSQERTYKCTSLDDVKNIMNTKPGFIKAMWCGDEACEIKMKEINGIKSRCIPFEQEHFADKCIVCGKEAKHMVVWGIQY